jgi:hypothetical protein
MRILFSFLILSLWSCSKEKPTTTELEPQAFNGVKSITYNGVDVNLVIDKPALKDVDVLIVYHGTVMYDSLILDASTSLIDKVKTILDRDDIMIVSVAYPEQNLLMGDNIREAEAGLLWVKHKANEEFGITVKKIFLCGHSQGGYLVTRLNTMHQTNGVIANGPGPLNLVYRCQLEENGTIPNGITCTLLKNTYGTTTTNPNAYLQRSLLNFTTGFKSDILFVQGLNDTPIQMYSWPTFKQDVMNCTTCKNSLFLELAGEGHSALFTSATAKLEFNSFINSR